MDNITPKNYFGRKRLTFTMCLIKISPKLKYYNFINLGNENIPKIKLVRSFLSLTDAPAKYDTKYPLKKKVRIYGFAYLRNKITYPEILLRKIVGFLKQYTKFEPNKLV